MAYNLESLLDFESDEAAQNPESLPDFESDGVAYNLESPPVISTCSGSGCLMICCRRLVDPHHGIHGILT